ncbi:glycine cleavage system protein GcvH [Alicyclobacillus fructus]|uniref:glycine cleavage system protein GcvH n=1 Tax=Alicyclobacillus fructus TaxID=2816082 RepID=UPI001A8FF5FD|nr:glycine cleavage system protein GcvH [Alicyclobacillus fructus]
MNIPEGLKYSREHEWVRVDGQRAYVGITDYAQDELGDIVYVELPEVGAQLKAGETFGTVESVKTVSDLYAPVSGRVVQVNEELANAPEKVNESPYDDAWMIVVEMDDPSELEALLDADAYRQHIQG